MNFSIRVIVGLVCVFLISCETENKVKVTDTQSNKELSFISPAFSTFNIQYVKSTFLAEEGDSILFSTGSKIIFPKNSLVDKEGNIITGKVELKFREFKDPLDFFIAGVPMQYDSANTDYTLESSGMCEILVSQNGKEVFVNQEINPIVSLASNDGNPNHNLYYLNEKSENWENKGKSKINKRTNKDLPFAVESGEIREFNGKKQEIALIDDNDLKTQKPIEPIKATGERPLFFVTIPNVDLVPEMKIFKNTKFELHESETNYDEKDASVEWESVKLDSTKTKGVYRITFSTYSKKVSYKVRPVYEGQDYKNALTTFKENQNKYIEEKVALDKKRAEEAAAEELRYEAQLKAWKEDEKKRKIEYDKMLKNEFDNNMAAGGKNMSYEIDRVFRVNQFGYWNCDQRVLAKAETVYANFIDEKGKDLMIRKINIVYAQYNSVFVNYNLDIIKIIPSSKTMMWSVVDDKLVYLTYADFKNYRVVHNSKKIVDFTLRVNQEPITSKEQLETILEIEG